MTGRMEQFRSGAGVPDGGVQKPIGRPAKVDQGVLPVIGSGSGHEAGAERHVTRTPVLPRVDQAVQPGSQGEVSSPGTQMMALESPTSSLVPDLAGYQEEESGELKLRRPGVDPENPWLGTDIEGTDYYLVPQVLSQEKGAMGGLIDLTTFVDARRKPDSPPEGESAADAVQEHTYTDEQTGITFTYLKQSVDSETPWEKWDGAMNEPTRYRTAIGVVNSDGMLSWTRRTDIEHDDVKKAVELGDEGYISVHTSCDPRSGEPQLHLLSRSTEASVSDRSLLARTVAYFGRSVPPETRSRLKLHLAEKIPGNSSHQYMDFFDKYTEKVSQGEAFPGDIYPMGR